MRWSRIVQRKSINDFLNLLFKLAYASYVFYGPVTEHHFVDQCQSARPFVLVMPFFNLILVTYQICSLIEMYLVHHSEGNSAPPTSYLGDLFTIIELDINPSKII